MLYYFRFFLFMIVGISLWKELFSSFNESIVDIIVFSICATFFKWLIEVTWERKPGNTD